jgi:cyclopropane fatty-acyl-phospholipid synthase-like methyltransferase
MTSFEKLLFDKAVEPYVQAGKFAKNFARGKLTGDPVFREILQRGLISTGAHVVDIGCGQGLLSAWMMAADSLADHPQWPTQWKPAPRGVTVQGIELMPSDVQRANNALSAFKRKYKFVVGDMCSTPFDKAQAVVILDVLHYVTYAAQDDVLLRVREALSPNGALILRIGDAAAGLGFKISNWVDNIVLTIRGHGWPRLYCRPLSEWVACLERLGFVVEPKPMSQGTPFANVLLVAHLGGK